MTAIYSAPMDDAAALDRALAELLATGCVEVREDGEFLAELAGSSGEGGPGLRYEIRHAGRNTFVQLWSEERNLSRRVLRVAEQSADALVLEVLRFGKSKPGRLEFCAAASRPKGRMTREKFRARFRRLLAEQFPDEQIDSLTSASDLEHSFSGSYTRGVTHRGQRAWAVLGVSSAEDAATIDAILTFGLLWLDWTRARSGKCVVEGLRLVLPEGTSRLTVHRLQALASGTNVELFEVHEASWRVRRVDPRDAGNLATWLTLRREAEDARAAAQEIVGRVTSLAPDAIDSVVPPGTRDVAFRFRGLEFARWQSGRLLVGLADSRRALAEGKWSPLAKLVKELATFRSAHAEDVNHPLFRVAPERWLESLLLRDIARVDARLDAAHTYPQVPALSASGASAGAGRGVIDLLSVTREGRLAVIEVKASEDIHLALQGTDYWLRVRWHQQKDEFRRYGYFSGVELLEKPPLLFLVSPALRYHPATDTLLRYISPDVEVVRVGINEDWRSGVRVVFRQ